MRFARLVFILILCFPFAVSQAHGKGSDGSSFTIAIGELRNGVNVGFALVRSGSKLPGNPIKEVIFPQYKGVNRVLYDQDTGLFFGYRLEVEALRDNRYSLELKRLPDGIEFNLRRRLNCPQCPNPAPLASPLPRFSGSSLILKQGGICMLDLLMNPQTGERIIDVITVSSQVIAKNAMRATVDKILQAVARAEHGDILVARGNNEDAVLEYIKALDINPYDTIIQNKLGVMYQRMGMIGQAQAQFEQVLNQNKNYAEAWNNLASCYYVKHKYEQSITYYLKAISLKPSFAVAYKNLASAYFAQKRNEDGYGALQAAFRLDPTILETRTTASIEAKGAKDAEMFFYFAKLSASHEQNEAALNYLEKAVALGFCDCSRITQDPDFHSLLKLPRFKKTTPSVCPQSR